VIAAVLGVIAATLPAGVRERYREEWSADAAGARGLGISPWSVVGGALGVAAGLDREDPLVSGVTPRRLMFRRMRVALAALATAVMLLLFGWVTGVWLGDPSEPLAGRVLLVVVLLASAAGLLAIVGALRARHRTRAGRGWGAADVAVAVTLPLAVAATVLVPPVGVVLVLGAALAAVVVVHVEDPRPQQATLRRGPALALAAASALGILAALAASLLHVFVWNPLAKLPGMTLDEIYAGLAAAHELPSPVLPIACVVVWGLAALALLVLAALPHPGIRHLLTARRLAGAGILGIALIAGGTWFLGFGMGMGIADAFMTTGGDAAVSGRILSTVGAVFGVAALLLGLLPSRIRPDREAEERGIPGRGAEPGELEAGGLAG